MVGQITMQTLDMKYSVYKAVSDKCAGRKEYSDFVEMNPVSIHGKYTSIETSITSEKDATNDKHAEDKMAMIK